MLWCLQAWLRKRFQHVWFHNVAELRQLRADAAKQTAVAAKQQDSPVSALFNSSTSLAANMYQHVRSLLFCLLFLSTTLQIQDSDGIVACLHNCLFMHCCSCTKFTSMCNLQADIARMLLCPLFGSSAETQERQLLSNIRSCMQPKQALEWVNSTAQQLAR